MKKLLIAAVVVILALPVVVKLIPKPVTFDRAVEAFRKAGFTVENVSRGTPYVPGAVEQMSMTINSDANVQICRFEDRGKIAVQLENQRPDVGSAIVQNWGLAESLGAAKPKNKPVTPAQNGMFLVIVSSEDGDLRKRIVEVFNSL